MGRPSVLFRLRGELGGTLLRLAASGVAGREYSSPLEPVWIGWASFVGVRIDASSFYFTSLHFALLYFNLLFFTLFHLFMSLLAQCIGAMRRAGECVSCTGGLCM